MTTQSNAFYLEKPNGSIFIGETFREYPNIELISGFIESKMGITFRKGSPCAKYYTNEYQCYRNYIQNIKFNCDKPYIAVKYHLPNHGWGRVHANNGHTVSIFHRSSRHAFCEDNYYDFDQINSHLNIYYQKALQAGIPKEMGLESLKEYCEGGAKKFRKSVADKYQLTDTKDEQTGDITTAIEKAKNLFIRVAYGGGLKQWKIDFKVDKSLKDPKEVLEIITCLSWIKDHVIQQNPHIRTDLEADEDYCKRKKWNEKSREQQKNTIFAMYGQTMERIIQEECIKRLVNLHPEINLLDIVPSQDGFMPLKSQIDNANIEFEKLFEIFKVAPKSKLNIELGWDRKQFDVANKSIPLSNTIPIMITYEDLEKGERHIADKIQYSFKSTIKYNSNKHLWYKYDSSTGLWSKNKDPPLCYIIRTLQSYIEELQETLELETQDKTISKESLDFIKIRIGLVKAKYEKVGQSGYSQQLTKYLKELLVDNDFHKKLDVTKGLLPFKDGIYNFKTGQFRKGFFYDDYISFTSRISYNSLKVDNTRMDYVKTKLKQITNNNDEHLEYFLSVIGHSMTGDASLEKAIYFIHDGTNQSKGNNGKTLVFSVLREIFPEYIKIVKAQVFEEGYARYDKFVETWDNIRILYADEGTKKKVDDSIIKKIGDGDVLSHSVMYGTSDELPVYFKLFMCSNHKFKVDKNNDAVFNRLKQINMNSHFDVKRTVDDPDNLRFVGINNFKELLVEDYRNEIVQLILEYGTKYYQRGMYPIPVAIQEAIDEAREDNDVFLLWFQEHFEEDPDSRISKETLISYLPTSNEELSIYRNDDKVFIKELKRIGVQYYPELKGLGKKKSYITNKTVYIKGGIQGYKVREDEVEDEDEIEDEDEDDV